MKEMFTTNNQNRRKTDSKIHNIIRTLFISVGIFALVLCYSNSAVVKKANTEILKEHQAPLELRQAITEITTSFDVEMVDPVTGEIFEGEQQSYGSGSVIYINESYNYFLVLTAAHVVDGNGRTISSIELSVNDETYSEVSVLSQDLENDIALLSVKGQTSVKPIKLAKTTPEVGSTIWYVGNPAGVSRLINKGIISKYEDNRMITSMAAVGGASGGIVVNKDHEVVGVISAVILSVLQMMPDVEYPVMHPTDYNVIINLADIQALVEEFI